MKKELITRLYVFILILFTIFLFLSLSGVLTSGFHFVDNHEVVQMNKDLKDSGGDIVTVIKQWVEKDINSRLRPVYMINNVIEYTSLKGNFYYLHLYHTLLISLITFLLFLFVRKLDYPLFYSILFPLVILLGPQSAIFWRLGPNETIGLFFLSLFLLSMTYAVRHKNEKNIFRFLICIFGLLTALSKESFLLLIPALIVFYWGIFKFKLRITHLKEVIIKTLPEVSFLSFVFISSLLLITLKINTENLGYAGIQGVNIAMYLKAFKTLFLKDGIGALSVFLFITSFFLIIKLKTTQKKEYIEKYSFAIITSLLIVFPQVYLYGKSGVFERYFVPGVFAWGGLIVFSTYNISVVIKQTFDNKKANYFKFTLGLFLLIIFGVKLVEINKNVNTFVYESKEVNSVLGFIMANSTPSEKIVFIAEPVSDFERTISFRRYLAGTANLEQIYTKPIEPTQTDDFGKSLINDFSWVMGGEKMSYDSITDKNDVKFIVFFPFYATKSDEIFRQLTIDKNNFYPFDIGAYKLFLKKDKFDPLNLNYESKKLTPVPETYNETSYYLNESIRKGDDLQIVVKPNQELTEDMNVYAILLDLDNPENIVIHNKIIGKDSILISKEAPYFIKKPWLIYRNWNNTKTIPGAKINFVIEKNNTISIPVR